MTERTKARETIRDLLHAGMSVRRIAETLGYSCQNIYYHKERIEAEEAQT